MAEVLPVAKVDSIRRLKAEHGKVAFVGDGINDAPALAEAVWVSPSTRAGPPSGGDVVLMSGSLTGVPKAIARSKATIVTSI
ncbi:HAD family hydrolase [Paracoccus mutanolyticus]|uniref:HAD family hydrolase n=1 Tax=Paracoccus mutanolyticus TaxID=1499308 RepID=UPI002950036B|nr:HAD family hydrolase [Paracoccus mutanolyticus]